MSLQFGHIISDNPVTSSIGACSSTAVGEGAIATIARGVGSQGTLATVERRVRAVDDDACDMSLRERGLIRPHT
jgi:hypothetical protein